MIQRIQTIFLVLAAACFGALMKVPLAASDQATTQFLADKVYEITDHPALMILTLLGAILCLGIVFLYRNRKLQIKLIYLVMLLAITLPLVAYLLFSNETAQMDSSVQITTQAGSFLPFAAIVFGVLANYFIRKDEKLVKSMDRLR